MRITAFTDYSLRVLIYLASITDGHLAIIQEIADAYQISRSHLMKVVHQLNKKGYIETVRGKNGGMRLRLAPEAINIGVLVREMESDMDLVECMTPDNACVVTPVCGLRGILNRALNSFLETLDQYTLADVLGSHKQSQLQRLLHISST